MTDYQDPGWGPALRRWPMFLLPLPTITFPILHRRGGIDDLTALRILWLAFATAITLFLLVLIFIQPFVGIADDWYLLVLLPAQLGAFGGILWTRRRPLDVSNEEKLVGSYRVIFFLGVAYAESIALLGFVGVFLVDELWPYLEALPLGLLGLALVAPTRREIARRQQEITAQGSPLSLGRALVG